MAIGLTRVHSNTNFNITVVNQGERKLWRPSYSTDRVGGLPLILTLNSPYIATAI